MKSPGPAVGASQGIPDLDADVLVIGAGIVGIYQLYMTREAGFDVKLIEAGAGVGGVWYWNRYPGARFDSESYTYAYLFSEELFHDWRWSEHFAGQPEIERYLNHVVDRFDLRRHMHFNARVTSAVYDESTGSWNVRASDGTELRVRIIISATGGLSAPVYPNVPGRDAFKGVAYHTARWPHEPVDFNGKEVAIVGTGPSGLQVVPEIINEAAEIVIYQRTPNWATPLNNRPITEQEHASLRSHFKEIRHTLNTNSSGFLHKIAERTTSDVPREEWPEFFEQMWRSFGFSKLSSTFRDIAINRQANEAWCQFIAEKIRSIVTDSEKAEKLIPRDHAYGGKRTPFVTGYFEAVNHPKVSIIDLRTTPMTRVTASGIETADGLHEFDIIVWATGFDFGTGSLTRMGIRGRSGMRLEEHWADGPSTYCGFMAHGVPNFFFPGGPHGAGGGNYPRYANDQVDFITDTLVYMREHGHWVIEVPRPEEDEWMDMVTTLAPMTAFSPEHSHYYGANIDGKPRKFLLNPGGRGKLQEFIAHMRDTGYAGFFSSPATPKLEAAG